MAHKVKEPPPERGAARRSAEVGKKKTRRGFAAMDPATRAEISSMGGRAAHAAGTAHQWTSEEAVEVGRKGGNAPHVSRGGKRGPASSRKSQASSSDKSERAET